MQGVLVCLSARPKTVVLWCPWPHFNGVDIKLAQLYQSRQRSFSAQCILSDTTRLQARVPKHFEIHSSLEWPSRNACVLETKVNIDLFNLFNIKALETQYLQKKRQLCRGNDLITDMANYLTSLSWFISQKSFM